MRTSRLSSVIGMACLLCAGGSIAGTLSQIHGSNVTHIVTSTGNIYWTEHILNEIEPSTSRIMRSSKNDTPGEARVLYSELNTTYKPFGRMVYAHRDTWYGYYIANDLSGSPVNYSSEIMRVPLAGGDAQRIATLGRYVGLRSLRTDGNHLYWADDDGIRRMPIDGGPVTSIASTTQASRFEIDDNFVYYVDGNDIRRVPNNGGQSVLVVATTHQINTLYVYPVDGGTRVLWGDNSGGVLARNVGSHTVMVYKEHAANDRVYGVGFDGTRVMWTYCNDNNHTGKTVCNLAVRTGEITSFHSASVSAGNMDNLQWDESHVYWTGSNGIQKFTH